MLKDYRLNIWIQETEHAGAGYGPHVVAKQWPLLAAFDILAAVGRRLNRDDRLPENEACTPM
jgi:hypothetical protein